MEIFKDNYLEFALIILGAIRAILAFYPTGKVTKVFGYLDDFFALLVGGDRVKGNKK